MIETEDDIVRHLEALIQADPRLVAVAAAAARPIPLRRSVPGLRSLCATIVGQQVSRASAEAIFSRLAGAVDLGDAEALRAADDDTLRVVGLSRPKQKTVRALAAAVCDGRLDFDRLARAPAPCAIAELTAIHGIGVWTAECYLLFALGHEDIFPAGDLALQIAVAHAVDHAARPKETPLRAIASGWSPHRSVAARLFWAYYHAITGKDAAPRADPVDTDRWETPNGGRAQGFTKAT